MNIYDIPSKTETNIGYYVELNKADTVDDVNTYSDPVEFRFEYVYPTNGLKTTMNQTQMIRTSDTGLPFKIDDVILIPGYTRKVKLSGFSEFDGGAWKVSNIRDEFMEDRIIAQWPFDTLSIKEQNSKKIITLG
jgi:hypothetical protein